MTTYQLPEAVHTAMPNGTERPGEHWNARLIREEAEGVLKPHGDLIEALEALLDNAIHSDECFIDPDETACVCLIGKVKATLPQCEHVKVQPVGYLDWRCTRTAHPASPDQHAFEAV